jgi:hypothetical protein
LAFVQTRVELNRTSLEKFILSGIYFSSYPSGFIPPILANVCEVKEKKITLQNSSSWIIMEDVP